MSGLATEGGSSAPAASPTAATILIDTDIHESIDDINELTPHLDPHWRAFLREHRFRGLSNPSPYTNPVAGGPFRKDWIQPNGKVGTDLDFMRAHVFDQEMVTTGILNGFFHVSAQRGHFELATALASAYNDWQIEHWLQPERRLLGSVHVVAHDPQRAAREIDRVAEHPQIVQVFLPTVSDRQYGDPYYWPIYEAAVRNGLVIALHHGGATTTNFGYPRYYIEWHTLAAPQGAINQLLSLLCNGVFDRFPDLRVVLLETGVAWVPWFMWRLDQQYRELRAEVPWVKRLPSEHMRESVRVATQPMGDIPPQHFRTLAEMSESERMYVFATDYPHYDADSVEQVVTGALPEGLRQRIRYQNALDTYPRLEKLLR
jgi:predicted TIM-barrel fold metal-dependent hydrolase